MAGRRPNRRALGRDFTLRIKSLDDFSFEKYFWRVRSPEMTLERFRHDTTAVEDLQQVVFKFPEFNKLVSGKSSFSYENSTIEWNNRKRFELDYWI